MRNNIRFDLSDWLLHFFREIDLQSSNSIIFPEDMGFSNIHEDDILSPLFMLRCAIRHGRLWATWAKRNGKRTIYGPNPAVCFTEMPIAAFLESSKQREAQGEAMSSFALVFPKKDMFKADAIPVIYGLSDKTVVVPSGEKYKKRIFDPKILPEIEQFRYVTYNPGSNYPVDWTHEREWRWPYRGDLSGFEKELETYGIVDGPDDIPGFDFYQNGIKEMGVIVKTQEQAQWVIHDILCLVDRGVIQKDTFGFVLPVDKLSSYDKLREPKNLSDIISESLIDLEPYFSISETEFDKINKDFSTIVSDVERNSGNPERGEIGGCWLWILDNTSILARALIYSERLRVSKDNKYLVWLDEFSDMRSMSQREAMTEEVASKITEKYGVECGYYSVLGSNDVNRVPFYVSDHLDNNMYYNKN